MLSRFFLDVKTTYAATVATGITGFATLKEWIPENIGWIASTIGAFGTIVVISIQLYMFFINRKIKLYELRIKKAEAAAAEKNSEEHF